MTDFLTNDRFGLLAILLLSCTGCAGQCCHFPDDCVRAFNQTQLGWELRDICNGCPPDRRGRAGWHDCGEGLSCAASVDCGGGDHLSEDSVCLDERGTESCYPRLAVGPPAPYEPPMPPKFLPVPARSVFSHLDLATPTCGHGQVAVDYGTELAFPSGG